jgi:RimJ/RimL family protein N-acetyltransferase
VTILRTERLVLRVPLAADAEDAMRLLQDPATALWFAAPDVVDLGSAIAWCERGADGDSGPHRTWHGVDPATDRLIVNVSLFDIDPEHLTAKVAYRVVPWERGRGFAREALIALSKWAFGDLGLARLQLEHSEPNVASCRVALGAGYRLEGTARSAYLTTDGVRRDVHIHGRLSTDPKP